MRTERKRILKQLEEGLISAEEAEKKLTELDERTFTIPAAAADEDSEAEPEPKQELVPALLTKEEQANKRTGNKTSGKKKSVGPKVFQFVQQAFTKIKNADLDLNFGDHYQVDHIYQADEAFSNLDFKIYNGSIVVKSWPELHARLETKAKVYQQENEEQARKRFMEKASFQIEQNRLSFSLQDKRIKTDMILYLPEKQYESCVIKTFNGHIKTDALRSKNLYCKTTNGSIQFDGGGGEVISAETSNGSIKAESLYAADLLAETVNGSLRLKGDFRKLDAQTFNGSIHCEWTNKDADTAFFKTLNGSIRLKSLEGHPVGAKLVTAFGGLHCDLDQYEVKEEAKEVVKKVLRFQTHPEAAERLHLEATTKSGSIWVLP